MLSNRFKQLSPLVLGPLTTIILLQFSPPGALEPPAWHLIALICWMVIWWMTEAVPVAVTALLPIPMMPLLAIAPQKAVAANYGNPLIFLFLGGFLIAAAMQRWGLHRRIALNIIRLVGSSSQRIIAGFMLATAFLSMWVSNTATTIMMFTVGLSIIEFVAERSDDPQQARTFGIALMLGIAYSASIGGVGTLIGTPPNTLLASFLESTYNIEIDFGTWMLMGIPVVLVMLPIAWLLLCKIVFPVDQIEIDGATELIHDELKQMGTMSRGEITVLVIFVMTALLWITRKLLVQFTGLSLSDTSIALIAAIALFTLPASITKGQMTLDWSVSEKLPWGVLLLFGGGLAIAGAFKDTGLAVYIGDQVAGMDGITLTLLILITVSSIVFLTEITSNLATTATFLPILGAVAVGFGLSPLVLAVPAALAASMAFMMPVATPPNAIVFSYKDLHIKDMMRAGLWLNLVAIAIIYFAVLTLAPRIFSLD